MVVILFFGNLVQSDLECVMSMYTKNFVKKVHEEALMAGKKAVNEYLASTKNWYPCGFAYVKFSKANTSFVRRLKELGIGHKEYDTGWAISSHFFDGGTQSMYAKMAGCEAYVKVLREHGINLTDSFYVKDIID